MLNGCRDTPTQRGEVRVGNRSLKEQAGGPFTYDGILKGWDKRNEEKKKRKRGCDKNADATPPN